MTSFKLPIVGHAPASFHMNHANVNQAPHDCKREYSQLGKIQGCRTGIVGVLARISGTWMQVENEYLNPKGDQEAQKTDNRPERKRENPQVDCGSTSEEEKRCSPAHPGDRKGYHDRRIPSMPAP
jgi:hypothetical protein